MAHINTKKFRGSRTCGGGTHKNRRGAGNRGGRGHAGANKHNFIKALKEGYRKGYINKGFSRPQSIIKDIITVNIKELDELVDFLSEMNAEYIEKKDDEYIINLNSIGVDKVLGSGKLSKKIIVTSTHFSKTAIIKIESAGGRCISTPELEEEM